MKYFWWGLAIYIVGRFTYAELEHWVRRKLFLRKIRKLLDEDDRLMAEARRKGLIP